MRTQHHLHHRRQEGQHAIVDDHPRLPALEQVLALEELEKLGEDYQKHGIVRVGAINCTAEVELCKDQEKGLKPGGFGIFGYGEEKKLEEAWISIPT